MKFAELVMSQRDYFRSGATLPIEFRLKQLTALKAAIKRHEKAIIDALYLDLHKPETEARVTEILMILDDLDLHIKSLKKWAKP